MTVWEYRIVDSSQVTSTTVAPAKPMRSFRLAIPAGGTSREDLEAYLNQLGADGWEVVSASWSESTEEFFALLKRPLH